MFSPTPLQLGRIAGAPVRVSWSALLIAALIAYTVAEGLLPAAAPALHPLARYGLAAVGGVAVLASILAHELGHAFTARRVGVPVDAIELWLFGGAAKLSSEPDRPGPALAIAAAGPGVSLALGAGLLGASSTLGALDVAPATAALAGWLGWLNLLLGAFNLLPGLPLDGGRIVQALLWRRHGDRARASLTAAAAGRVVGLVVVAYGLYAVFGGRAGGLWTALVGLFVLSAAKAEQASVRAEAAFAGLTVGEVMTPSPVLAPDYLSIDDFAQQYAAVHRRSTFPVQEFSGRVAGVVSLAELRRRGAHAGDERRLHELMTPAEQLTWAGAEEPLLAVLRRARPGGDGTILVGEPDRLVGMVTKGDLARAAQRRPLTAPAVAGP